MNKAQTRQWDNDIEKSLRHQTVTELLQERFINEEMKQHMGNLFSLSDGRIGKEYKPDIKTNLMSGKIEGKRK